MAALCRELDRILTSEELGAANRVTALVEHSSPSEPRRAEQPAVVEALIAMLCAIAKASDGSASPMPARHDRLVFHRNYRVFDLGTLVLTIR